MTPRQIAFYWRLVSAWRAARLARGLPAGDAERHALTRKALGYERSSKQLTNAELDRVLAALFAEARPNDLDAQLRQIDQPEARQARLLQRLYALADRCGVVGRSGDASRGLDDYLVAKLWPGKTLAELTERQLQKLAGILSRRACALTARVRAGAGENPF